MKKFLIILAFTCSSIFSFTQISSFPWTEDFESASIPIGWSQQYQTSSVNWITNNGSPYGMPSEAYSGTKNAFFAANNYDENQTVLITPALDLTGLENPVLSFYHMQVPFDTDQDKLYVYYKTSAGGSWILLASYTDAVLTWTNYEILLPEVSSDFYIGFSAKSGYGFGVCIDMVKLEDQTSCTNPTGLTVLQTWETGALIKWDNESNSAQWQIEYGLQGYTHGGGTIVNSDENIYSFSGLSSSQSYVIYLRSFCNPLYSDWVGPYSFTTDCSATTVFPFNESFENSNAPAHCWTIAYSNSNPNSQNLVSHSTQFYYEGNRSVKFSSFYSGSPYNQYLISRQFDFSGNMQLSFRYRKNITGLETFCVGTSSTTNDLSSFSWGENITNASTSWKYLNIDVASNTKYIAIQYKSNFQNSLFIDDLKIDFSEDCYPPIDITISNVGSQEADLAWLSQNGETEWVVEYGDVGFTPGTGTVLNITENPYTLTGLNPETNYDIYISSDCGAENSAISSKTTFTTLPLCIPLTVLNVIGTSNNSVNLSWIQNAAVFYEIEYGVSGFSHGTGLFASSLTGSSHNITGLVANTEYDFYIRAYCGIVNGFSEWLGPIKQRTHPCSNGCYYTFYLTDYWGDGWDDVSLDIYQNSTLTNNITMTAGSSNEYQIFICEGADVEILLNQNNFSDECAYSIYTPYDVFVTSKEFGSLGSLPNNSLLDSFTADCSEPTCYPPVNPHVTTITHNSCKIIWSSASGVSNYRIEYGIAGFLPGTGTFLYDISALNYQLSGLLQSTNYEVYVYSDCNTEGLSDAVGPISFTTLSTPVALDFCGLNIAIADNANTQINFNVSGENPTSLFTHKYPESISFIIQHTRVSDIDMYLESPEGVSITLVQDAGANGQNFGDVSGSCTFKTNLSLNPSNGNIMLGSAPFNGNYSPIGDLNNFNNGENVNGIWKLHISDDNALFTGQLLYFNIEFSESKTLVVSENTFYEAPANNGSITNTISIELYNESFASTGILNNGTDYSVQNLPAGLGVSINVIDINTAELTLTGNSINHIDDIANLIITFNNICFTGADTDKIDGSVQTFTIDFFSTNNLSNNAVWETIYCFDPTAPVYVSYKITNDGESYLAAGTEFLLIVESPIGASAFIETIEIENSMPVGSNISGICSNPLYFAEAGSFAVKTIIDFENDSDPLDNEIISLISAATHQNVFPQAENDTIYVASFPFIINSTAIFNPTAFEQTLLYHWNGIEGTSSFETSSEEWIYLNTESSYCNILDSVFIILSTEATFLSNPEINIYPNPANDFISLVSPNSNIISFNLLTIDGRLINKKRNLEDKNFVKIQLNDLMPGVYIIIIETTKGEIKRNFIKI